MKDIVESQTKQEYEKGNVPPKRYIITEAPVRLQTPRGMRRYPAGTMFQALSFLPVNEEQKVPPGRKLGELVSTEERPLTSTVSVVWAESPEEAILWESEPSLRQKIAGAEARVSMLRAIAVGAAAGTAVAILQGVLPVIADWVGHWSGIIMGVVVGVIHANPEV
ncbi:MAG: hypothetical protein OXK77_08990 [Gemmatimonadota bacterium]|nr:hypothetical protein [Gemmatimonadota bacterium]MDE2866937.1 hypothetical protein [Gemmatimonadota bacterium]